MERQNLSLGGLGSGAHIFEVVLHIVWQHEQAGSVDSQVNLRYLPELILRCM